MGFSLSVFVIFRDAPGRTTCAGRVRGFERPAGQPKEAGWVWVHVGHRWCFEASKLTSAVASNAPRTLDSGTLAYFRACKRPQKLGFGDSCTILNVQLIPKTASKLGLCNICRVLRIPGGTVARSVRGSHILGISESLRSADCTILAQFRTCKARTKMLKLLQPWGNRALHIRV